MLDYLKVYAATFVGFLVIDLIWIGFVARGFYKKHLGHFLSDQPIWWAALLMYLLFVAGLLVFAVEPGVRAGSLSTTLALGAFFGLVTYATYDLTNLATLKDWPRIVAVVDVAWGAFLAAATSAVGYAVARWLGLPRS